MISIIIPTLWNSQRIYKTIEQVSNSNIEGLELIIIDNANSEFESPIDKIKIIKQVENIFVNPAWNLGVKEAKNEYVCLMNDDININLDLFITQLFSKILNVENDFGMLAIQPINFHFSSSLNKDDEQLEVDELNVKGHGFGQLMVFHKSTYEEIPENFKIFFGDDIQWFVHHNQLQKKNFAFKNLKIMGQDSVTSMKYMTNGTIQDEALYWDDEVKRLRLKYKKNE